MSLEAALDEERREIMEILEGKASQQTNPPSKRDQNESPLPAIRSMLDIAPGPAPRHGSIAGIGVGVTPASPRSTVRSLLDPQSPISSSSHGLASPTSPTVSNRNRQRSSSDASQSLPRVAEKQKVDIDSDYQFEMLPSIANQALPKRVGQTGKIGGFTAPTAMAAAMSGDLGALPSLGQGRETSRQRSALGLNRSSKSPSGRLGRSSSPNSALHSSMSSKYVTDSGKVINMDKAYRRLSDAALLKSGGSLSEAARRNKSAKEHGGSADSESPDGQGRLEKDYPLEEGQEGAVESSADESEVSTSEEEGGKSRTARGRPRKKGLRRAEKDRDESSEEKKGVSAKGSKPVQSLLSAMEEERMNVSSKFKAKKYSEPSISITSPAGERLTPKKSGVHPHTSFDHTASGVESALSSDEDGDTSQIKRAQKLSINLSPIDRSVPNRTIRTILRGDFNRMQQDARDGTRRQRLYLVATDLSDEAVYALEWTIGTILRDGDTLFAIYAAEDEVSGAKAYEESNSSVQIGEGSKAVEDVVSTLESLTEKAMSQPVSANAPLSSSTFMPATAPGSRAGSRETRGQPKLEVERTRAIEDITSTCLRLLRKTRLQARVAIEVIHCKSPKHMITEAIDGLEPTLVILGSRGRSALKGVLLGSFSNYLVTKSSVPVMVARKKLRKHAKFKNTNIRLSNNLTNPKRLATAKID
ncbi:MAG: hypothetical protein Q9160_000104 [Pyrenula sp. 1 TL-2023]